MVETDRVKFAEALAVLADTFTTPLSAVKVRAYFEALHDLPLADVLEGCHVCLRTLRFFPRPVEIREAVLGPPVDQAEDAWLQVLGEIRRVGWCGTPDLPPAVLTTVRRLFGSWRGACEVVPAEGPEAIGWAKQFKACHAASVRHQAHGLPEGPTRIADLAPRVQDLIREHFPKLVPAKTERGEG